VALGLALGIVSVESAAILSSIAAGRVSYPFFGWVPHPTGFAAMAMLAVGLFAAICLIVGLLPASMSRVGAGTGLLTLAWDQHTYSSHLVLLTVLLVLLSFTESDRRWAVSKGRYRTRDGVPWWPQLLMMTQVSTVYLFAGLSKAQPTFLRGAKLEGWMWPDLPAWAFAALAGLTVVTEVTLAFALWVPTFRLGAVLVGLSLHASILIFMNTQTPWLVGFALATMSTYPLFLTRVSLQPLVQALRQTQEVVPQARRASPSSPAAPREDP